MNPSRKPAATLSLVIILAIGLVTLSSWKPKPSNKITSDTTRKSERKKEGYSRKTVITIDENGKVHEQIIEDFDGAAGLNELSENDVNFDFPAVPDLPDFEIDVPSLPGDFMMPPMPDGFFYIDSLDFDQFGLDEDFGVRFREQFERFGPQFEAQMEAMRERFEGMEFHLDLPLEGLDDMLNNEFFERGDHLNSEWEHDFQNNDEEFLQKDEPSSWEYSVNNLDPVVHQELVKDGYVRKSEKIESMSWCENEIKFNGKAINSEHQSKYQELMRKYFRNPNRGRPE